MPTYSSPLDGVADQLSTDFHEHRPSVWSSTLQFTLLPNIAIYRSSTGVAVHSSLPSLKPLLLCEEESVIARPR